MSVIQAKFHFSPTVHHKDGIWVAHHTYQYIIEIPREIRRSIWFASKYKYSPIFQDRCIGPPREAFTVICRNRLKYE